MTALHSALLELQLVRKVGYGLRMIFINAMVSCYGVTKHLLCFASQQFVQTHIKLFTSGD